MKRVFKKVRELEKASLESPIIDVKSDYKVMNGARLPIGGTVALENGESYILNFYEYAFFCERLAKALNISE